MTVRENLDLGAYRRPGAPRRTPVAGTWSGSSRCSPGWRSGQIQKAGTMSGGEQQMLAIGRALMARPRLLLLDEPSLGIAPVRRAPHLPDHRRDPPLRRRDPARRAERARALDAAVRGYVLETGRVVLDGADCRTARRPEGAGGVPRSRCDGAPRERKRDDRRARAVPAVRLAGVGGGRRLARPSGKGTASGPD